MGTKFSQLSSQLEYQKLTVNFSVNFSQPMAYKYMICNEILSILKVNLTRKKQLVD